MNGILQKLMTEVGQNPAGAIDRHIAEVMLDHISDISETSIGDMAQTCAVSKSTISKFVRKIGFEDYSDFKYEALRQREKEVYSFSRKRSALNISSYIIERGTQAYLETLNRDIQSLFSGENDQVIDELVRDLHVFRRIGAVGEGYSGTACKNFQTTMSFYRRFVFATQDDLLQAEYIESSGEDTVLLVFSNSGFFFSSRQDFSSEGCNRAFNKSKARIYLVTSNEEMLSDPRVHGCILMHFCDVVQNHPVLYQLVIEQIELAYRKRFGFPQDKRAEPRV